MKNEFDDSVLIVAHPDDECLWFSSILQRVDEIVICYEDHPKLSDVGPARRAALTEIRNTFVDSNNALSGIRSLGLVEVDTFPATDWDNPMYCDVGLCLTRAHIAAQYETNFHTLVDLFSPIVANKANVYTHNPWGEYGHADHVQVFCVLRKLQSVHGFRLWHSNYVSEQTVAQVQRFVTGFDAQYEMRTTEPHLAHRMRDSYKRTDSWTWFDDYAWFAQESFVEYQPNRLPSDPGSSHGSWAPLNYLKVGFETQPVTMPNLSWRSRLRRQVKRMIGAT